VPTTFFGGARDIRAQREHAGVVWRGGLTDELGLPAQRIADEVCATGVGGLDLGIGPDRSRRKRGKGGVGRIIDIIAAAAAIAEEVGAAGDRAVLRDDLAIGIADVDQHRLCVILRGLHMAGPQPVGIDRPAREAEAGGADRYRACDAVLPAGERGDDDFLARGGTGVKRVTQIHDGSPLGFALLGLLTGCA
jgi:hypothetical protein